jgi:hypothetical protein
MGPYGWAGFMDRGLWPGWGVYGSFAAQNLFLRKIPLALHGCFPEDKMPLSYLYTRISLAQLPGFSHLLCLDFRVPFCI